LTGRKKAVAKQIGAVFKTAVHSTEDCLRGFRIYELGEGTSDEY
jgi:hypothetical protein